MSRHDLDNLGTHHHDLPRKELLAAAEEAMQKFIDQEPEIHFKFTCEECGERCMLSQKNMLYEKGECHKCGHETEIKKGGFALMLNLKK
jgi:formylmethanofuran dehydrogenase subunit E